MQDETRDVAVDSFGNAYLATIVGSGDFLDTVRETIAGTSDIGITKLSSDGTQILYNTFIGGSLDDDAYAIDVDAAGNAYIAGITSSMNFPLLNARQVNSSITSQNGAVEGFVAKLDSSGTLAYSTYHGSILDKNDYVDDLDVDSSGNVYLVGENRGGDFPVLNAFQNTLSGERDVYLSKLSPTGVLLYSTYFGGATIFNEGVADVAVDNFGGAYITGQARDAIPLTANPYLTTGRGYVAKFNTKISGSQSLIYSTKIPNDGEAIGIDSAGNAYVIGTGVVFPNTGVKLNASRSGIFWNFPTATGYVTDIAVDANGNAYYAEGLETFSRTYNDGITIRKISAANGSIVESISINGSNREVPQGIAYSNGHVYVVGYTSSSNFPTTELAIQPQSRSLYQGFFTKIQIDITEEREPLIFILGVSGSLLDAIESDGSKTNLWLGLFQNYNRL